MAESRGTGATKASVKRTPAGVAKAIGLGFLALVLAGALLFGVLYAATPIPDPNREFKTENTTLYFRDGKEVLGTLSVQNRSSIPYSEMPQTMKDAMVAAENMTFWTDPGIDLAGLARAVQSAVGPGDAVGGSTITQQYVKVLYLSQEKTLTRKLKEIIIALKVGKDLSKEQILEGYLNTVYFGRGAYGVQAAAQAYFGIDAQKLNVQQAVALASLVNAPGLLDPALGDKQEADLLERYQVTLNHLVDMGKITESQRAKIYTALPAFPKLDKDSRFGGPKGFLMTMAQRELKEEGFTDAEISGGGLSVVTTFDNGLQDSAVEAAQLSARRAAAERGKEASDLHPAIASIDNATGGVLALYGGPDYVKSTKNWATTPRPTGSTFKPWALVAALRNGFSLNDTFNGTFFRAPGETRAVRNAGGAAYGPITMADATTNSVNTAYMDIVSQIPDGPNKVIGAAEDAGLPKNDTWQPVPSIPLGFAEVAPVDVALGLSTLANEGVRRDAHVVAEVKDRNGQVLYRSSPRDTQAIEKDVAINAASALTQVTRSGTGSRVSALGHQVAGKTGTRYDSDKDATLASWFVGSTKQISTAVMFVAGDAGNSNLDDFSTGFYGSGYPARTWLAYMRDAMRGLPEEEFSDPVRMSARSEPTRQYVPPRRTTETRTRTAEPTATASRPTTAAPAPTRPVQTPSPAPTSAPAPTRPATQPAKPTPTRPPSTPPTATRPAAARPTVTRSTEARTPTTEVTPPEPTAGAGQGGRSARFSTP